MHTVLRRIATKFRCNRLVLLQMLRSAVAVANENKRSCVVTLHKIFICLTGLNIKLINEVVS